MINKQIDRLLYLGFLVLVYILDIFTYSLIVISPIIKSANKKYNIGLYPYTQKGSDGYQRRFVEYMTFLAIDKLSYKLFNVCSSDDYMQLSSATKRKAYSFYLRNYIIRIGQTLQIRHCERAFIHRNLIPYFFDKKNPLLERLAKKLCGYVVIDYWDAVWVGNKKLINRTAKYAHKISVVNTFLKDYFIKLNPNVDIFTIGINIKKYNIKQSYELSSQNRLTLVYTGLPGHTSQMMGQLKNVWKLLNIKIRLILISEQEYSSEIIEIEHHKFNENTFFELLTKADIGIYAVPNNEYSKGKLAMKTLDYAAAGLPQICTPYGLSNFMEENINYLPAITDEDWVNAINLLYEDILKRQSIGLSGRKMVQEFHDLESSYNTFKIINKLQNIV